MFCRCLIPPTLYKLSSCSRCSNVFFLVLEANKSQNNTITVEQTAQPEDRFTGMMSADCFHSTECLLWGFLRAELSKGCYFGLRKSLKGYSKGREHGLTTAYVWGCRGQRENNSRTSYEQFVARVASTRRNT